MKNNKNSFLHGLIYLMLLILLVACSPVQNAKENNLTENRTINSISQSTESDIQDENITDLGGSGDDSNQTSYTFYKDVVTISPVLKEIVFDNNDGTNAFCHTGLYDDSRLIVISDYLGEKDGITDGIYLYDIGNSKKEKITQFTGDVNVSVVAYNQDYIIYDEQYDDGNKSKLYSFEVATGIKSLIHEYYYHPDTGRYIIVNSDSIVIKDDYLYFDDYLLDDNEEIMSEFYVYNLKTNKLENKYQYLQNAMIYNNEVYAFSKNENGDYKRISNVQTGEVLLDIDIELSSIISSNDGIFAITFDGEPLSAKCSIINLVTDEVILSTTNCIADLEIENGNLMWSMYDEELPYYYNILTNKIVKIAGIDKARLHFYPHQNQVLIVCVDEDSSNQIYKRYYMTLEQ